jgi:hypothetical protein
MEMMGWNIHDGGEESSFESGRRSATLQSLHDLHILIEDVPPP